jgi:predicted nucleic acid-binding protein
MDNPKLLIDTSIIIDHFRKKDKTNTQLINFYQKYLLHISSVTVFELYNGASTSEKVRDIELLLKNVRVIDFSAKIAFEASKIYRQLLSENKVIEFRDIFIASTAKVNKLPLATLNISHFERIKGIKLI